MSFLPSNQQERQPFIMQYCTIFTQGINLGFYYSNQAHQLICFLTSVCRRGRYDVALWATISDFPYSWPLWQRYSSKFVATQLVRQRYSVFLDDFDKKATHNPVGPDGLHLFIRVLDILILLEKERLGTKSGVTKAYIGIDQRSVTTTSSNVGQNIVTPYTGGSL